MQQEELREGKGININEQRGCDQKKKKRCPRGKDTGKNFTVKELSDTW